MSEEFIQLAQQDVERLLCVSVLPPFYHAVSDGEPLQKRCLIDVEAGALRYCISQTAEVSHETVLVAFGERLTAEVSYALLGGLRAVIEQTTTPVAVSHYQPIGELPPAVVISGLTAAAELASQLDTLAVSLGIELVLLQERPTIDSPGLLLMDMDSTAIEIECIDEIAKLAGVGEAVAQVTARAMRGELDFAQSLHHRVAALSGADEGILTQVRDHLPLMPGLERLIAELKRRDWVVAIVSGGFTYFTDHLREQLGLDATFANQLEIIDGKLSGKVLGEVVDGDVKAQTVEQLAQQYHIPLSQTVTIGDGANDLKMLAKSALGVAFHAKPLVRQQAKAAVNQGGLDQLLYLLLPKQH